MRNATDDLHTLIIYRKLLQDPLIKKILTLLEEPSGELQAEICFELIEKAETLGLAGAVAQEYMLYLIAQDENIFSQQAEKNHGNVGDSLKQAAVRDIQILRRFIEVLPGIITNPLLAGFEPTMAKELPGHRELSRVLLDKTQTPEGVAGYMLTHYSRYGYGSFASYAAFRWITGQGLAGVSEFETVSFQDIIGYEKQKNALIANTEAFVQGKPCNNVLLVGSRGTGKSSCVKALINRFYGEGLRLVEVSKHDQRDLHNVLAALRASGKRFIVYLDDLSFEENESEYKHLKSILEGGVEARPANVLIYATSNRHHLIRETWNDRNNNADDLHRFDTVNEKLSLADRFGLTVTFIAPNQQEYMAIVEGLANKHRLGLSSEELRSLALKWEMTHSGRSGRVARQFIDHLLGSH